MNGQPPAWYTKPSESTSTQLENLYKSQAAMICNAYAEGDKETVSRLCTGALGSTRLPAQYRLMYETFLQEINKPQPMTIDEQAAKAEEIVTGVLANPQEGKDNENEVQELREVVTKAKTLKTMSPEQRQTEQIKIFQELLVLGSEVAVKEGRAAKGSSDVGDAMREREARRSST